MTTGASISATDGDRCWYGNGRVKFRDTNGDTFFEVDGGDDIPERGEEENNCKASTEGECTANIRVFSYEGAEPFINNLDRELMSTYSLNIEAYDNPQSGEITLSARVATFNFMKYSL